MKVSVAVVVLLCSGLFLSCTRGPKPFGTKIDPPIIEADNKFPEQIKEDKIDDGELKTKTILDRFGNLNPVFFDYDRAEIRTDQIEVLQTNAQYLRQVSVQRVQIQGHCDERGTEEYNLALGDRRARAVKDYLSTLGIAQERLNTVSYGESIPFEKDHDETAWGKNRRAQFKEEN